MTKSTGQGAGKVHGLQEQVWTIKSDKKRKTENLCLWMAAGVVQSKTCRNFDDCVTCKYDLGMQKQVLKGKQISWQDAMRKKPDLERVCRHSLTGRISKRLCAYDYQCATCDFDQLFEDVWTTKTQSAGAGIQQVKGFDISMGAYYHNGHTWARIESGGNIRVGLDDFSMKLLGKIDALDLPLMGKALNQGEVGWGLKRKENLADVLSPVDGIIVEVNSAVRENPELANREPYRDGWLFSVRTPDIKGTMKKLMTDADSLNWINAEVGILENMIEDVAGPLSADGGLLASDIFGNIPDLGWDSITKTFLKT